MTESEWQTADEPIRMLRVLRATTSDRKVVLFNVACCRHVWQSLGPADRAAVCQVDAAADDPAALREFRKRLVPERAADLAMAGLLHRGCQVSDHVTGPERELALAEISLVSRDGYEVGDDLARLLTTQTKIRLCLPGDREYGIEQLAFHASRLVYEAAPESQRYAARDAEERMQTAFLRCVFGNPFHPVAFDPAWRSEAAVTLAAGIYAEHAFDRMPILADALEEAGCDHLDILTHCRGLCPHVRGCWVVDLVFGKG